MATKVVEGFIGSSDAVPKYGGVALAPSSLRIIAEAFKRTTFMNVEHDSRQRVNVRVLDADLRPTERGSLGVWVKFEVDEEGWRKVGGRMGFSVSVVEPVLRADPDSKKPVVFIGYEAGRFDDTTLEEAVAALRPYANVSTGRLYQFGFSEEIHVAKVVAEFLITTIQSVGANAIYDALKLFLKPSKGRQAAPTIFDLTVREEKSKKKHTRVVSAYIQTDDSEVLRQALTSLESAFGVGSDTLDFDSDQRKWKELP